MKRILAVMLFLVIITMGCSQIASEVQNDKEYIYIGENEKFNETLIGSEISYTESQKGDNFDNIDVVITDNDYLENTDDGLIHQLLEKDKEVFIVGYKDTKYISKKFFNLDSFDEVKDNNIMLLKLQKINGELKLEIHTIQIDGNLKNEKNEVIKTIINNS